jgi:hypothetical protein
MLIRVLRVIYNGIISIIFIINDAFRMIKEIGDNFNSEALKEI